ncbi:MAG TPA: hypothetical protein VI636_02230 [Candidatus Angelobacter sp.]
MQNPLQNGFSLQKPKCCKQDKTGGELLPFSRQQRKKQHQKNPPPSATNEPEKTRINKHFSLGAHASRYAAKFAALTRLLFSFQELILQAVGRSHPATQNRAPGTPVTSAPPHANKPGRASGDPVIERPNPTLTSSRIAPVWIGVNQVLSQCCQSDSTFFAKVMKTKDWVFANVVQPIWPWLREMLSDSRRVGKKNTIPRDMRG